MSFLSDLLRDGGADGLAGVELGGGTLVGV